MCRVLFQIGDAKCTNEKFFHQGKAAFTGEEILHLKKESKKRATRLFRNHYSFEKSLARTKMQGIKWTKTKTKLLHRVHRNWVCILQSKKNTVDLFYNIRYLYSVLESFALYHSIFFFAMVLEGDSIEIPSSSSTVFHPSVPLEILARYFFLSSFPTRENA